MSNSKQISFQPSLIKRAILFLYAAAIVNFAVVVSFHIVGSGERFSLYASPVLTVLTLIAAFLLYHWSLFKLLQLVKLSLSLAPSLTLTDEGITCRIKGAPAYAFLAWSDVNMVEKGKFNEPASTVIYPNDPKNISVTYYWWFKIFLWLRRSLYNRPSNVSLKPTQLVLGSLLTNVPSNELFSLVSEYVQQHSNPDAPIYALPENIKTSKNENAKHGAQASQPRPLFLHFIFNIALLTIGILPVLFFIYGSDLGQRKLAQDPNAARSKELIDYARAGDANAQLTVGLRFDNGIGLPKSATNALDWYKKAAQQGLPEAQYNVGVAYMHGRGAPRDFKAASEWLEKAVDQDFPQAFATLGFLHLNGQGVPQSDRKAFEFFERGTQLNNGDSQYFLGLLHENGRGTQKNINTAIELYRAAAINRSSHAERALNRLNNRRN